MGLRSKEKYNGDNTGRSIHTSRRDIGDVQQRGFTSQTNQSTHQPKESSGHRAAVSDTATAKPSSTTKIDAFSERILNTSNINIRPLSMHSQANPDVDISSDGTTKMLRLLKLGLGSTHPNELFEVDLRSWRLMPDSNPTMPMKEWDTVTFVSACTPSRLLNHSPLSGDIGSSCLVFQRPSTAWVILSCRRRNIGPARRN